MIRTCIVLTAAVYTATLAPAQSPDSFEARLKRIIARPEFRHSRIGVEIYSVDRKRVLYALHPDELFIPGSTTKLLTIGSALELLGPDFRFHTKIYGTGPIGATGTLQGDLILVGSGDPNLSGRIQPDGSMIFENEDHAYDSMAGSAPVPGNPMAVINEFAAKIAAKGIKRIEGRILADATLFEDGPRELGSGVVISPIVVNDNLVDVVMRPGAKEGEPALFTIAPVTRYVKITNNVKTIAAGGKAYFHWSTGDMGNPDGTHTATLNGEIPLGASEPILRTYRVPQPSKYAEIVLSEALATAGVTVSGTNTAPADFKDLKRFYTADHELAEHVSPPLKEEAKVTLKVSQNLHASMMPSVVGAYLKKGSDDPLQSGFDLERGLLEKAGLDITAAVQSDGAGGAAMFTPDFMVHFLLHMANQPFFPDFFKALPVLGKDGTLVEIQKSSPAAGHVFAKTGTYGGGNALNPTGGILHGKGLAGYIDTKDGHRLVFAAYINWVPVNDFTTGTKMVGEAVGEIAAAAYDGFLN